MGQTTARDADDARVWLFIDWAGRYVKVTDSNSCANGDQFKEHYEEFLNSPVVDSRQDHRSQY